MSVRVVVVVLERFTDSGPCVLLDVLRTANVIAPGTFALEVASAEGGTVRGASGFVAVETRRIRGIGRGDVVVVPGLWATTPAAVDAALARSSSAIVVRALQRARARGALVSAICAGVFWLAEAGLLDGRRATTSWWLAPHLRRRRPAVDVDARAALVVDGSIVTAGAVFAVADLALHLVARFAGPSVAQRCASLLLLDPHASQAPYMAMHTLGANDETVRAAEAWARAHLGEPFDVATLAKAVGTSSRTLARKLEAALGMSPIAFVRRIRLETAVQRLKTTRLSVDEIARSVGYGDVSTLRRLLRAHLERSPREIRRQRAAGAPPPRRS